MELLEKQGAGDIKVVVRGMIPDDDIPLLKKTGTAELFTWCIGGIDLVIPSGESSGTLFGLRVIWGQRPKNATGQEIFPEQCSYWQCISNRRSTSGDYGSSG